jgi:hypothetical protein
MRPNGRLSQTLLFAILADVERRSPMIAERLVQPAPKVLSPTSVLRQAWACWWWLLRAHVADSHLMPRDQALEPPPSAWIGRWPRDRL